MMRGFARNVSGTSPIGTGTIPPAASLAEREPEKKRIEVEDIVKNDMHSFSPAIQRFVNCRDARELNGYDVDILLRDYQRLAGALKTANVYRP